MNNLLENHHNKENTTTVKTMCWKRIHCLCLLCIIQMRMILFRWPISFITNRLTMTFYTLAKVYFDMS